MTQIDEDVRLIVNAFDAFDHGSVLHTGTFYQLTDLRGVRLQHAPLRATTIG